MAADSIDFKQLTYAEIEDVYLDNLAMSTVAQCTNLLQAIRALRLRRPQESDKSGERIAMADLSPTEQECRRELAILQLGSRCPTIIVPPDDLH